MKLDKIDVKILHQLDLNARIPDTKLAKRAGRSREAVRYRINQLKEKGVIRGFSTIINPGVLGYQAYSMFASVGGKTKDRDEFYQFIREQKNLFWFEISEGGWDIYMVFYAKTHHEFLQNQRKITAKYRNFILEKTISIVEGVHLFPKKYLLNKKDFVIKAFSDIKQVEIDEKDFAILQVIAHQGRAKLIDIARETKLSVDIVRGRMKKMEEKKVILGYSVDIDNNVLGLELFKVLIHFKNPSDAQERRFLQYCQDSDKVISYIRTSAPWDAEINVVVPSFKDFNSFIRGVKDMFSDMIIDTDASSVSESYLFPNKNFEF
jgi:DNA-binding Lrp family transcriptional regulator